jgi:hypothetical protein
MLINTKHNSCLCLLITARYLNCFCDFIFISAFRTSIIVSSTQYTVATMPCTYWAYSVCWSRFNPRLHPLATSLPSLLVGKMRGNINVAS